jgi:hypothetical protein
MVASLKIIRKLNKKIIKGYAIPAVLKIFEINFQRILSEATPLTNKQKKNYEKESIREAIDKGHSNPARAVALRQSRCQKRQQQFGRHRLEQRRHRGRRLLNQTQRCEI